jgi:hypothetical protein
MPDHVKIILGANIACTDAAKEGITALLIFLFTQGIR